MSKTYPGFTPDEERKERKELFDRAIRNVGKKPKRIPIISHSVSWMFVDENVKLSETLYDWDKVYEVFKNTVERYEFDLYASHGERNNMPFTDPFGKSYVIDDENFGINYPDYFSIADADDYPQLFEKGIVRYYFENGLPRKFGLTDPEDIKHRWGEAIPHFYSRNRYSERVTNMLNNEYGVPIWAPTGTEFPCDTIFKALRGMKEFAIDLRRRKDEVHQAIRLIDEFFYPPFIKALNNVRDSDAFAFGSRGTSLCHTFLNRRQFEELQYPFIKRFAEDCKARDLTCNIFMEGELYYDCFRDIPDGCVSLQYEYGDSPAMKKALPNVTLTGGMNAYYVGRASVQECLDEAKKVIDELGYDGHYIFTTDKMLSFPGDAKRENFIALNEFLKSYAVFPE